MKAIKPYSEEIEAKMVLYYQSLSEKDRRRYAAIEAEKLGYGGISYIARLLECRPETIENMDIIFDEYLPEWNYVVNPKPVSLY